MLLQLLDDTFKNIRCYSKCCQVNECSCTSTDTSMEDEVTPHHRQFTEDSQITNHSHHHNSENAEGDQGI